MSLDLDKRQRAMLREMGIRLWQPQPTAAPTVIASTPTPAALPAAEAPVAPSSAFNAPPARRSPVEAASATVASAAPSNAANATTSNSAWTLGEARALYTKPAADNGQPAVPGATARWLLLIEAPPAPTEADPLAGEAGKLLDNMLRAAGLQHSASAVCAQLSRRGDAATAAPLEAPLTELLKTEKPDVILIMGRLAAQALLQSTEPLGKLRGHVHQLAGIAAVVTYDAAYLLRSLPDKAKAWDDLCRAQHIAQQVGSAD
ncbi:MAG: uracil-DNA glycosylase family protein [Polaromonas sp.]|jgi:uracil-DNA glycosylase family 4